MSVSASVHKTERENVPEYIDSGYVAPEWLRYARTIFFDGYSPPIYPDFKRFDARMLVEKVLELGGDTLRFQPIGYWAYYPSAAFPNHPNLGSRDLIEEVSAECRRKGVHLYCYTGYGAPFFELGWADEHHAYRDWIRRDPDGKPSGTYVHYGSMLRQKLCRLGDAYRAGMQTVVREFCEHDIDGVYFDAPSCHFYTGVCFCDSCRKHYKEYTGLDIDRLRDPAFGTGSGAIPAGEELDPSWDPARREAQIAWYDWANSCTREDMLDFRRIIHGAGKFMLCHNAHTWTGVALPLQYRIPDGFMIEHSVQTYQRVVHGMMGAAMARPYKKLPQMYLGSYCVSNFNEPAHQNPWVVHNSNLEDDDEIRMEGITSLACGSAPLYATANRLLLGMGGGSSDPAKEVYGLMRRYEPLFKDSKPLPYAGLVMSWDSMHLWHSGRRSYNWEMAEGFALAMLDEHLSFDVCPSTEAGSSWLAGQRVVVLCGASAMSGAQAAELAAWVRAGGSLLATWDTGLYDEEGIPRTDGGALCELLGVEMLGEPLRSMPDCYFRVLADHPALGSYKPGAMFMGDGRPVPVRPLPGAEVIADCWDLGWDQSRGPAIVANRYGAGRTIYMSGSLEAQYTVSRVPALRHVLGSCIRYLAQGTPPPFELTAPIGVYGIPRQAPNEDLLLWVLAPVGFKDAVVGRMRQEYVPVSNVEVRILIPPEKQVRSVHLLRAGRDMKFTMSGNYAMVRLPAVHIGEIVHVELR